MLVPKGDVLHQFRQDVRSGKLPAVSWLVAPKNFSDHPGAPWFGAWYVSEVLDILTQNPEVWKKTIFILCYDENDGYFDHVPPFVAPHPQRPETGKASGRHRHSRRTGAHGTGTSARARRDAPGLLDWVIRVPLLIASPWSRGGYVCSQVFDHTSILQFLEILLSQKTGKPRSRNQHQLVAPDSLRRSHCRFRPYHGETVTAPEAVKWAPLLGRFTRPIQARPQRLQAAHGGRNSAAHTNPAASPLLPRQEPGVRLRVLCPTNFP